LRRFRRSRLIQRWIGQAFAEAFLLGFEDSDALWQFVEFACFLP